MKKTLECPKCSGRELWRVDTVKVPAIDQSSIKAAFTSQPAPLPLQVKLGWRGMSTVGGFEAFICAACGFTEWYAHGLGELQADEKAGIQHIDSTPRGGLR